MQINKYVNIKNIDMLKDFKTNIHTLEDAEKYLSDNNIDISKLEEKILKFKQLNKICKALNKNKIFSFTDGPLYYPTLIVTEKEPIHAIYAGFKYLRFKTENKIYYIHGDAFFASNYGFCSYCELHKDGSIRPGQGLLGCASMDVALYISTKFTKLLFDAFCLDKINYEWID
jgi:DNA-binding Xre family transcriptional regulator